MTDEELLVSWQLKKLKNLGAGTGQVHEKHGLPPQLWATFFANVSDMYVNQGVCYLCINHPSQPKQAELAITEFL